MFLTILVIVAILLAVFSVAATYLLWPVPILSYQQGGPENQLGTVVSITTIRPGVTEVGIQHKLRIDPQLQQGNMRVVGASFVSFIHFRGNQKMPQVGDSIEVTSVNRLHHFTGRSYNWVISWTEYAEAILEQGLVTYGK